MKLSKTHLLMSVFSAVVMPWTLFHAVLVATPQAALADGQDDKLIEFLKKSVLPTSAFRKYPQIIPEVCERYYRSYKYELSVVADENNISTLPGWQRKVLELPAETERKARLLRARESLVNLVGTTCVQDLEIRIPRIDIHSIPRGELSIFERHLHIGDFDK